MFSIRPNFLPNKLSTNLSSIAIGDRRHRRWVLREGIDELENSNSAKFFSITRNAGKTFKKGALKEKQYMQCITMQLCWQQNYGKVTKYACRYKKCYFNCTPNSQETFLQLDDEPICYSLIFQSWHIHLLPVLIKTRDHDRLYQRYSVIKNLNHV